MIRLYLAARIVLPLLVAGMLFIQNPLPDPMLLIMAVLFLGVLGLFVDTFAPPGPTLAWLRIETFVRVALVCSAFINCRDVPQAYHIAILSLMVFQALSVVAQNASESVAPVPMEKILLAALVVESGWLLLSAVGNHALDQAVPRAPLCLMLCASIVLVREYIWWSLSGARRLSPGQHTFMWERLRQARRPDLYWIMVHRYFRDMQWSRHAWLEQDLRVAVSAAPMEYLVAYVRWCFSNEYIPGIPQWPSQRNALDGVDISLYDAMSKAIEERMKYVDYRATIAWSMASSSQEALRIFERMMTTSETIEQVELPAL